MPLSLRSLLLLVSALVLSAASAAGASASGQHRMAAVHIKVTATDGTVWGTVTTKYTFEHKTTQNTCSDASCSLRIPRGVTLHLGQSATDTATWPFKDWQIKANHKTRTMTGTSVSVKVKGSTTVTALYVLEQNQSSSGSGSDDGGGYYP